MAPRTRCFSSCIDLGFGDLVGSALTSMLVVEAAARMMVGSCEVLAGVEFAGGLCADAKPGAAMESGEGAGRDVGEGEASVGGGMVMTSGGGAGAAACG